MTDEQTIEGTVELTATLNEERCWPTHHDYQQAQMGAFGAGPRLIFCRLCGDVVELKAQPRTPTIATED